MSEITPAFQGEMQLMNWGESSANGAWVKFWITPDDLEAFRHLKCRSGKIAGHRMAAVLVEIGDDERPVQPEKPKGGPLAKLAGLLCADPEFQNFIDANDAEDAANLIRSLCQIESRAELDNDDQAASRFHANIRGPWLKYRAARGG